MADKTRGEASVQHVFIIGSKSIGQYGGYETFVDRLIGEHENEPSIKYHIACKANGDGCMDETRLPGVKITKKNSDGSVKEFEYKNAHVFKISCPNIGPAVAIYYDRAAVLYSIKYCKENHIDHPIFYILTCRIGLFISALVKKMKSVGGRYFLNPDGHEWKRAKWPAPVRRYWKWSEKKMVGLADLVICDSVNIEKYIRSEYGVKNTTFIAYGADVEPSSLSDNDEKFTGWLAEKGLSVGSYYLVVGRFVPENNFETMIREFMKSQSKRDFALITNVNEKFLAEIETKLGWKKDPRIKFVGTVYDRELLKKIRENAYAYFHGHSVGGTNPSLLEALGSTDLNLLLDVGFNREVGEEAALYWDLQQGSLSSLIDSADKMNPDERVEYLKGLLTYDFTQAIISLASEHMIPIIIDVKDPKAEKYCGATLLKPNLKEIADLTGMPVETDKEIIIASETLRAKCNAKYVLTTCGGRGMVLVGDGDPYFIQAFGKEVFDVTGAGDTTIAYLATCMANGMTMRDSVDIANLAAGIQVSKVGTSSVYWSEIRERLSEHAAGSMHKIISGKTIELFREDHKNQKIVFTNGCFDILHIGHIRYLQEAAKLGDVLIIGLNSDDSVKRLKGPDRPINNEVERAEMLSALGFVDYIVIFSEDTPLNLINLIKPDVLVKGGDYFPDDVVGRKEVEARGGQLVLIPFVEGISTTKIIERIKK